MSKKIKLLIVDDEIQFLDSIARRLEMRDFDVTTASDGMSALALARGGRFDLALVDLKMPGMKGEELLAALKAEHRFLDSKPLVSSESGQNVEEGRQVFV